MFWIEPCSILELHNWLSFMPIDKVLCLLILPFITAFVPKRNMLNNTWRKLGHDPLPMPSYSWLLSNALETQTSLFIQRNRCVLRHSPRFHTQSMDSMGTHLGILMDAVCPYLNPWVINVHYSLCYPTVNLLRVHSWCCSTVKCVTTPTLRSSLEYNLEFDRYDNTIYRICIRSWNVQMLADKAWYASDLQMMCILWFLAKPFSIRYANPTCWVGALITDVQAFAGNDTFYTWGPCALWLVFASRTIGCRIFLQFRQISWK